MPVVEGVVRDRRVRRTQQLLQDALRKLLITKPIDQIAVLEITEAASVNRATFYDHYTDKFDLFNALIAAEFGELLDERNVCFDGSCASGLSTILLAVGDYLERIHSGRPYCAEHAPTGPLIDAAIVLAVRKIMLGGAEKHVAALQVPKEVFAAMLSGTIYGAVKELLAMQNWKVDEAELLGLVPRIQPLIDQALA